MHPRIKWGMEKEFLEKRNWEAVENPPKKAQLSRMQQLEKEIREQGPRTNIRNLEYFQNKRWMEIREMEREIEDGWTVVGYKSQRPDKKVVINREIEESQKIVKKPRKK